MEEGDEGEEEGTKGRGNREMQMDREGEREQKREETAANHETHI